jgi:acyl carrier protein
MSMEHWNSEIEALIRPHLTLLRSDVPVAPDLDLRTAGLDSLGLVELLVNIEDTFGIEFPDELLTAQTFRTPATVWAAVATLRNDISVDAG